MEQHRADAQASKGSPGVRLLLADDHAVVGQGIKLLLAERFDRIDLVCSGEALIDSVEREQPDVVVADISMPGLSGIDAMRELARRGHILPFVFLTQHGDTALAAEAVRAGARGYVLKSAAGEELVRAVEEVLGGRTYVTPGIAASAIRAVDRPRYALTEKQLKILEMVSLGLRSKQIAYHLGVSVRTVESHKYAIMQELDVHGTVELVRKAQQEGLVRG